MPITIDHHDILKALGLYKLEVTDYYLEFDNNHVYMHWVSCPNDIEEYLKNENDIYLCLDFQVKGKWLSAEYFVNDKEAVTERPFINCRYLLEIN
jgi:hypothetical protein